MLCAPWLAWRVFGVPVREVTDGAPSLSELLGRDGTRLQDALATAPRAEERLHILQNWLAHRCQAGPAVAPQVLGVWRELVRTHGRARIQDLVTATGWNARTLERRFAEQIGQPPKKMARVLRLRQAIDLLVGGTSAACVAATCGFHDQAHFTREVKAMTELTPAALVTARAAGAGSGPPLDRLRDHVTSILLTGTS
jgi:AraC-like DNA-binding protein